MRETSTLGELLVSRRHDRGIDILQLSETSSLSVEQIEQVESGRHRLSCAELRQLLSAYRVRPISSRLTNVAVEISLEEGLVTMTSTRRRWAVTPDADRNLLAYLTLLYEDRGLSLGQPVPLKSVDLSLLRAALAIRRPEVEAQLERLGSTVPDRLRRNKSLLMVAAAAGVAVVAGAITLIPAGQQATSDNELESPTEVQPQLTPDPRIEIGTPLVVERSPDEVEFDDATPQPSRPPDIDPGIQIGTTAVVERSTTDLPAVDQSSTSTSPRGPPLEGPPAPKGSK